ncbi:MAG: hypothetical protein GY780_03025 [bacterium]|nr:hypothetical protein [bacterium]
MKGHIVLNQIEVHRAHVLEQVSQDALSLKEASAIMGVSYIQAKRIQARWSSLKCREILRFWEITHPFNPRTEISFELPLTRACRGRDI